MRLYVDDDLASPLLAQLLHRAGHDVRLPADLGMTGSHDADHLRQAVHEGRVCLSRNYRDFEFLHLLVLETGGHHPGILIVRLDNDAKRDLKPREIAKAIGNVETANVALTDQYIILNHWR